MFYVFTGENVLVIGTGNSGIDIAWELLRFAASVVLSGRDVPNQSQVYDTEAAQITRRQLVTPLYLQTESLDSEMSCFNSLSI